MCDRVAILREGKVVIGGAIRSLLRGDMLRTDVMLHGVSDEVRAALAGLDVRLADRPGVLVVEIEGEGKVRDVLRAARSTAALKSSRSRRAAKRSRTCFSVARSGGSVGEGAESFELQRLLVPSRAAA